MPGVIGFVGQTDRAGSETLLKSMAQAMKDQDWYQSDLHYDNGIGLGRVSLGLLNPESQPIWNEDKTLCIIMEGELFDTGGLKQKLVDRGHRFQVNNDAELVLHLYEEYGENFASSLNGAFAAALWNPQRGELTLVTDHLGSRPLYYSLDNGGFAFASGMRALLAHPAVSRVVDRVAIAQMLTFEYVLGDRTLLNGVQLLPQASILTYCDGHISIKSYWELLRFDNIYEKRSEEDFLEGLIHYLRQAVTRQLPGSIPAGLNLSGGLDSRMLLGHLDEGMPKGSLHTFTFGIPGCDDIRFARELARKAGTQHTIYELKPDYLLKHASGAVRITDGMGSCIHVHALAHVKDQSRSVRMLYTGYLLDSLIGPDGDRTWLAYFNEDAAFKLLFDDLNKSFLFSPNERARLTTPDFQHQVDGIFDDSFRAVAVEAKSEHSILDWQNNIDLLQRQRRFTGNGTELLRSHVIARTPFGDKDLAEYCRALPTGLRFERHILKRVIALSYHKLAKVPWDKTGLPLTPSSRDTLLRFDQQVRWHLRNMGLSKIPVEKKRSYVDYNRWLRSALRPWVEEILLDNHSLERGYFNPDYVRKLVSEHMAGTNHANRLGILLSLEMWHRQFLD